MHVLSTRVFHSELNEPDEGMDLDEEDEGFSGWRGDAGQGNRWDGHMLRDVGVRKRL